MAKRRRLAETWTTTRPTDAKVQGTRCEGHTPAVSRKPRVQEERSWTRSDTTLAEKPNGKKMTDATTNVTSRATGIERKSDDNMR